MQDRIADSKPLAEAFARRPSGERADIVENPKGPLPRFCGIGTVVARRRFESASMASGIR